MATRQEFEKEIYGILTEHGVDPAEASAWAAISTAYTQQNKPCHRCKGRKYVMDWAFVVLGLVVSPFMLWLEWRRRPQQIHGFTKAPCPVCMDSRWA